MTTVRSHERQKPRKPEVYIKTNLSLMASPQARAAFIAKHGVELVGSDDPRLSQPVQPPANGSAKISLREITNQLMALARSAGYRG